MVKNCKAIQYGKSYIKESWIFEGGRKEIQVPIILMFYLLETEDRKILVDAGCDTMKNFVLKDFIGPVVALKAQGVEPAEISDIILTHAHGDHAQGVRHFPNATIYVHEKELEKARQYFPGNVKVCTFFDRLELDGISVVTIGGHSEGSCVVEFSLDGKNYVICGDECYTHYNLKRKVVTAKSCCKEASLAFIEKYANDAYICLLSHDL